MSNEIFETMMRRCGVYSAIKQDQSFFLFKIADLADTYACILIYDQEFATRPESPDLANLSPGAAHENGWKTAPYLLSRIEKWQPVFVSEVPLTEEEELILVGWKALGGLEFMPPE